MIKRILLRSAVNILNSILLASVKSQDLQMILDKIVQFIEKVVNVLTDNDKNDKEQIQEVWKTERMGLAVSSIDIINVVIQDKVENPELKEAALIQTKALKEILESLED